MNIPYSGGLTYTDRALKFARTDSFQPASGDRDSVPNIAIVTTDGGSTHKTGTIIEARKLHATGVITYAIGIGDRVNVPELGVIASEPKNVYTVASFSELRTIQHELEDAACKGMREGF